jgi:predicted transcriptional regulator
MPKAGRPIKRKANVRDGTGGPITAARLTSDLRRRLEELAERESRPLSYFLRVALRQYLEQREREEQDDREAGAGTSAGA